MTQASSTRKWRFALSMFRSLKMIMHFFLQCRIFAGDLISASGLHRQLCKVVTFHTIVEGEEVKENYIINLSRKKKENHNKDKIIDRKVHCHKIKISMNKLYK